MKVLLEGNDNEGDQVDIKRLLKETKGTPWKSRLLALPKHGDDQPVLVMFNDGSPALSDGGTVHADDTITLWKELKNTTEIRGINEMDLNDEQKKWCTRLLKTLNAMPDGIEVCFTYSGSVDIRRLGTGASYFDETGHLDEPDTIVTLYPKNSVAKRIDGRDSMA